MKPSEVINTFKPLRNFKSPWRLVGDRLGLTTKPYTIESKSGRLIHVRPGCGDRYTVYEVFGLKEYGRGLDILEPGGIVVDIGANIGCFAVEAAARVGPTGKVYAFEPEASTYERLLMNIAANDVHHIKPSRTAISSQPGEVTLFVSEQQLLFSSLYSSVEGRPPGQNQQRVKAVTLEKVIEINQLPHIDLLKLDCEGAEHDIIAKMPQHLLDKVHHVIMELHTISGYDSQATIETLLNAGFRHHPESTHFFDKPVTTS